jgi:adenylate kinase
MQVIAEEAMNSYEQDIVVVLKSNTVQDMESNVERIHEWVENWIDSKKSL